MPKPREWLARLFGDVDCMSSIDSSQDVYRLGIMAVLNGKTSRDIGDDHRVGKDRIDIFDIDIIWATLT